MFVFYVRILLVESLLFVFHEKSLIYQYFNRYTSYLKYFKSSILFAKGCKQTDYIVAVASRFVNTINSMFLSILCFDDFVYLLF